MGVLAGGQFVRKHYDFAPDISKCPDAYCGVGAGPLWTPNNLSQKMWFPDCNMGSNSSLAQEMAKFNAAENWKLVYFHSRAGDAGQEHIMSAAWWLPVASATAPRIVLVHGNNVNANDWTVQVPAYILRSMGFAVLLVNLRDHGLSGKTSYNTIGWGWAYHLDVLGAWDFVVSDPHGILGGPVNSSKVGIQGVSMGGMAAFTAFAMNSYIPALWLDSAVFSPKHVLQDELAKRIGFLAPLFYDIAWEFTKLRAGVDTGYRLPGEVLRQEHKKAARPVAITHASNDMVVQSSQADMYMKGFLDHPGHFVVRKEYRTVADCGGTTHAVMAFMFPDMFRLKLCEFWCSAFNLTVASCGISSLPDLSTATSRRLSANDEASTASGPYFIV